MDHGEAREALDLAASEPGGLARLMAGDTPQAAAVAGHLAGCDDCGVYLARLRRDEGLIREVVRTTPRPELRERTLVFVAEVGRTRAAAPSSVVPAPEPAGPGAHRGPASAAKAPARVGAAGLAAAVAAIAAVLVLAVVATAALVAGPRDRQLAEQQAQLDRQQAAIAGLDRVTTLGLIVASQPDARHVALAGGEELNGTILYSPSTTDLVVVARGLQPAPAGREYRCWVEIGGERRPVGRMFFGGDLAFWAGPVTSADLAAASRFGVTLVEAGDDSLAGEPVLSGQL